MECFAYTVNGLKALPDKYTSAEKQGWCKVAKKNSPRHFYVKYNIFKSYVYIIYFVFYMFWSISIILANVWLTGSKIHEIVLFNNIFAKFN